jgi:hypothetical protein
MQDLKSEVDFLKLSELCLEVCEGREVKFGDWTQRDVELFCEQFKEADLDSTIDMDRLDPRPFPRSYFEKKFPFFDEHVIDALYECENKKLEDTRLCPLRFMHGKTGSLAIENNNKIYNAVALQQDDQSEAQEAEEETAGKKDSAAEAETSSEADSYSSDRFRWFKTAQEEEED